ncbi:MAG: phosphatase PAP2 family protein [Elusimicrobiaceae bacterium]|nr:phosphatase PAP2 family protein [Elusimicrobiaceae bacterium]MBP5404000.1 phosphatase PAP2 family protein [Elusimicrobiaceae bacterium]
MDITYLLWLQDIRITAHDGWTTFMQGVSSFGSSYALLLPILIYWCWDKRRGLLTLASLYVCLALTALIKLTACVYRPWVRDPRVVPAGKLPSSYSFPSRHTSMATTIYLGASVTLWQHKKTKWLVVLCVLAALLTGFSRNYLGVHTPQDVLVGLILSVVCLCGVWKLGGYLQQHPENENRILLITAVACLIALGYIYYKSYPMDYVDGKLLVSPRKAIHSGFESIGGLFAFCLARYIEKTWIRFQATGLHMKGIVYGMIGLIPLYLLLEYTEKPLKHLLGAPMGCFTWAACLTFYIVALYPLILKWRFGQK